MRLKLLERGEWQVCAVIDDSAEDDPCCPLLEFLIELPKKHHGSRAGLFKFLREFATHGPRNFNSEQCHYVDKEEKIWQFVKGDLRILWFYGDERKLIICTHGFVKSSAKTPISQKEHAIAIKQKYLTAARSRAVTINQE